MRPVSDFATNLRRIMRDRGMTQAELGRMVGISQGNVSMYVTGKREPRATYILRIATALGVTTDELLGVKRNGD